MMQLHLSAREHICRTLQEKVRDLESQLAEERKTRQKQETRRALDVASSQSTISSYKQALSTISEKRPPLGPSSKLRLPLRRISNFMPSHPSPATSQKAKSFIPSLSNEDKENLSRPSNMKSLPRARRGSIVVKPTPPVTSQVLKPKRRASIATFLSESSSNMMNTPMARSNAAPRVRDRVIICMGSAKGVAYSICGSASGSSKEVSSSQSMTIEATPVAAPRSSKFMGSPPSHVVGSWKPKHPTVVALQRKTFVWSPLRYKGATKGARKSFVP